MKTDSKPTAKTSVSASPTPVSRRFALPFGRVNYLVMLVGIALIFLGFFIMTLDKEQFGFGFLGLTLGPIVTMTGFLVQFVAILRKP